MSSSFSKHFAHLQIPLKDIASATNSFSDTNLIGESALRKVYKGRLLRSEQQIDIVAERLLGKDGDKKAILQTRISILSSLKHENLVSIVGFCDEKDEKIIIYKHEANGSLEKHLKDPSITWMQRLEICVGVARALSYIHYDKERNFSLIHCNIKSSQILLDANWNAKLSGFKFSKITTAARRNRLHLANLNVTKGYMDPSYEKTGGVTHKTDVYSFGVVLFEVLCGRRAYIPAWRSAYSTKQPWKEKSLDVVGKLDQIVEHDGHKDVTEKADVVGNSHAGRLLDEHPAEELLDVVGKLDDSVKHAGRSPPLAKQNSAESSQDVVRKLDEGRSPQLAKEHLTEGLYEGEGLSPKFANKQEMPDVVGKLDETARNEGHSHQLAKPSINDITWELDETARNEGRSYQLAKPSTNDIIGELDETTKNEGRSHQLAKPSTNDTIGELDETTRNEGRSYQLAKPSMNDIIGELDETARNEGRSHQLAKPSTNDIIGELDEMAWNEGRSHQLAKPSTNDIIGELDEMAWNEGRSHQLAKPSTNDIIGELDANFEHERHPPRSFQDTRQETADNFFQPMSIGGILDMRHSHGVSYNYRPPSFGAVGHLTISYDPTPPSLGAVGYIKYPILRQLDILSIDKELLAQLAIFHYDEGTLEDIIDTDLWKQIDKDSFKFFSEIAYNCLKEERGERPHIDQIIIRLDKALDLQRKHENNLKLKEKPEAASEVEGTSTNHVKWKGMEHLMIGYNDIEVATSKFTQNRIGYGGFGDVYKAELEHFDIEKSSAGEKNLSDLPKICSTVAVKRLFKRTGTEADTSFAAEIKTLTSCKHPNIVSLLGFCDEGSKMFLVYEYVPKGSLDDNLRSKDDMINLKWAMRLQICLDIAEGLHYLHTQKKIIHRDIKSANILLDHKWRAKIADFGLSKIIPESQQVSYFHTKVSGTIVYLDPEYKDRKILRTASDIYSLGVVLFEIVSGTLAYDTRYTKENPKGIAHFARQHFNKGTLTSMLDPILKEEIDENNFTLSKGPNQGSLKTFLNIAHKCLAETQADRPKIGYVISKIKDAMNLQENHRDNLKISLEDIKLATNNFSDKNLIGRGGSARVYKGEVTRANRCYTVAAKRLNSDGGQHKNEFMTELEILQDYKHESVIGLVGFCYEKVENIIVYEFAYRGSLDMHLKDYGLTWMKRLQISIDIASGLDFLHGSRGDTQEVVIHRDIKSSSILLTDDWKAKICDFGISLISPINNEMDFVTDNACGAINYRDPVYLKLGYLTEHSDIYSFGVVLIEILCGRLVHEDNSIQIADLTGLYKNHYENGTIDEIVFGGIKEQAVPESLITFQKLAYECLYHEREKRPTTHEVLLQLKNALEFQEDYVIWKPKLPNDYEEIFKMSNSCDVYSTEKKKELYNMLRKGILLQHDKVLFSLGDNGERNEMISARKFSYKHRLSYKWQSIPESRFPKVAKMSDLSNLTIRLKIRPQLLARGVNYSVHLFFKFCGPRKSLAKGMYVNLKYKLGIETLHAYFATWREDGWMMIELCRFSNDKEDIDFEFLLESFSRCYCGSRAIYVEGIQFLAIDNVKDEEIDELKNVPKVLKSDLNMDQLQKLMPTNCEEIFNDGEKILLLVNGKKHLMLSAKAALLEYPNAMPFQMKPSTQSRFGEEIELLPQQVLRINCRIKSEWLSGDMEYVCYLVFKISEKCIGLHCPVKVHNLLHGNNKKPEILYFRCPRPWNLHDTNQAPKQRADGWMEVRVWKLNSKHRLENDDFHVKLKLIIYEGTMSGLILCGLEFRAV